MRPYELREFIENNEDLINACKFNEIYKKLEGEDELTKNFTELLLKANINPLNYMDYVPSYYSNYDGIKEITIPDNIKTIQDGAFLGSKLSKVNLSKNLNCIGDSAFMWCRELTEIQLPSSLKILESKAFSNSGLKNIVIPDGVEEISDGVFLNCDNLNEIVIPKSVKSIGALSLSANKNLKIVYEGSEEEFKQTLKDDINWITTSSNIVYLNK